MDHEFDFRGARYALFIILLLFALYGAVRYAVVSLVGSTEGESGSTAIQTGAAPAGTTGTTRAPAAPAVANLRASGSTAPAGVDARSFLVADADTGEILAAKNALTSYPIASITKLMTALAASQNRNTKETVTITPAILDTDGSIGDFHDGEHISVSDLFYPLLMESSNDAAEAISSSLPAAADVYGAVNPVASDTLFVKIMDAEAAALGMAQTSFADSSGLSPQNVSTATDLFALVRYLYAEQPLLLHITALPEQVMHDGPYSRIVQNANLFNADPRFIGGKVGYTPEAGETMAALFRLPAKGAAAASDTHAIAFIVLDSGSRAQDIGALVQWYLNYISAPNVKV